MRAREPARGRPGGQATWSGPAACSFKLPAFQFRSAKAERGTQLSAGPCGVAIMWPQAARTEGHQLEAPWPQGNSANLEALC